MATAKVAKTNFAEQAILNHILRGSSMPNVSQVYVALFTTDPGETGTGAEVAGGGYARQAASFTAPVAQVAPDTGSQCENSAAVVFPEATASQGTVGYIGIMDAPAGGNMWYKGPITVPKAVDVGDEITFKLGAIKLLED